MSLIQELKKKKIIDEETASSLLSELKGTHKREEEVILEKGIVDEDFLFALKSKILGVKLKKIRSEEVSAEILDLIPKEAAEYYNMVPLKKENQYIEIGMVYPEDLKAQEALKFLARQQNFQYKVFLITLTNFKEIFKKYESFRREVKTALEELEKQLQVRKPKEEAPVSAELITRRITEAPISKMVAVILRHAVDGRASDIHIEPLKDKTRVRFRLDGVLHSSLFLPKKIHPSIVARIKVVSNLKIDETRIPQDGRFSIIMDGINIDFRVSTFPTMFGEKVVMRVLNPTQRLQTFEDLGLGGHAYKIITEAMKAPYGMILATGPTGCGKTTTLYVILEHLNQEGTNIVTLEDPVEYYIQGINQSQVKPEIGYTFANGLRHVLRQDPDIIMVGEIRDTETAELATHAALTGHIVLSTLHTNNTIGVVPRLIDLGVKQFLIPPTINIAIAQRLVRKICPHCKKRVAPQGKLKELIKKEIAGLPPSIKKKYRFKKGEIFLWEGEGCVECARTGFSGRIGIFEVLKMTKELAKIVLTQPSEDKIAKEAKRQGMLTMRQDGILKALEGITTIEEVLRVTEEEY
jgi:type IV pilus assembly protein PilB